MRALLFLLQPTLKMAGDGHVIVSALWRLNVYGAIMARLLFDPTELEKFWYSTMQSYQKLSRPTLEKSSLF